MKGDALNHVECAACFNARTADKNLPPENEPPADCGRDLRPCCFCGKPTRSAILRIGEADKLPVNCRALVVPA